MPRGRSRPSRSFIVEGRRKTTNTGQPRASFRLATRLKKQALEAEYQRTRDEILQAFERENQAIGAEYSQIKQKIDAQAKTERSRARKAHEETRWQALAMYEAARDGTVKSRKRDEEMLATSRADFENVKVAAEPVLGRCRALAGPETSATALAVSDAQPKAADPDATDPDATDPGETSRVSTLQQAVKRADDELLALEKLGIPSFLQLQNFIWPFLILGLLSMGGLGLAIGWIGGAIAGVVIAVAAAVGSRVGLAKLARPRVAKHYFPLLRALEDAEKLLVQTQEWIKTEFERRQREAEQSREREIKKAEETLTHRTGEAEARQQHERQEADVKYPARIAEFTLKRDADLKRSDEHYPPRIKAVDVKFEQDSHQLQESFRKTSQTTKQQYDEAWSNLIRTWTEGLARVGGLAGEVNDESARRFLDWNHTDLDHWKPPAEVPPALPFGTFKIDLSDFPSGLPVDPRLKDAGPTHLALPAFVPFPIRSSVLIKTAESGKSEAVKLLQAIMLRFLTSVPPGKVRFTIFDPVGLGENFAAFMHLADYHELLVTSRIWTETPHFDQRLTDLQAHMENVIQKYLRNEFETIEEYNSYAGEVAEPFRVLVVANFPTSFNESAARRLMSIVSTGARCGVYALISLDTKLSLPAGCQLKDLESFCVNVNWKENRLQWRDSHFGRFPLVLDAPPDAGTFSQILHLVGEKARDANRVEVPFEFIAPPKDAYWTSDSRSGVDIPLGRAAPPSSSRSRWARGQVSTC